MLTLVEPAARRPKSRLTRVSAFDVREVRQIRLRSSRRWWIFECGGAAALVRDLGVRLFPMWSVEECAELAQEHVAGWAIGGRTCYRWAVSLRRLPRAAIW